MGATLNIAPVLREEDRSLLNPLKFLTPGPHNPTTKAINKVEATEGLLVAVLQFALLPVVLRHKAQIDLLLLKAITIK